MEHKIIEKGTDIPKGHGLYCKGFMPLEMIIAMAIFSIMILAVVAAFSSGVLARRDLQLIQNDLESARTSMELMAKIIRMSTYLRTSNGNPLDTRINMFNSSQNKCVSYRFTVANNLEVAEIQGPATDADCAGATYSDWQTVFSGAEGLFQVVETSDSPMTVGRATILLNIRENYMQSTVSFREY